MTPVSGEADKAGRVRAAQEFDSEGKDPLLRAVGSWASDVIAPTLSTLA